MNTKDFRPRTNIAVMIASTFLLAGVLAARAEYRQDRLLILTTDSDQDSGSAPAASAVPAVAPVAANQNTITIETVEPSDKKESTKRVTWLGLAVEESSEALSSQLGLKTGEGLTVSLIAAESPAAKADFRKNDVLVELDGQMLVHPIQLRKLVQMHEEGDTVKLTFYRSGKKQTISVKLGKATWPESLGTEDQSMPGGLHNFQFQFNGLDGQLRGLDGELRGLNGQMSGMGQSLALVNLDKDKMNLEIKRTMDQTRRAIQDSVRHASSDRKSLTSVDRELEELAREGVDVDKDATVIIRNKRNTNKTMVQTDDSGSYIIEAGEKTHLTARDKQGKLLFEGDVDTQAEREKVPKEVWEKVAPMLDQIIEPSGGKTKKEGKAKARFQDLKQISCQRVVQECLA